jgi:hypothetical protein
MLILRFLFYKRVNFMNGIIISVLVTKSDSVKNSKAKPSNVAGLDEVGNWGVSEPAMADSGPNWVDPAELFPTHSVNKSPREMEALKQSIRRKGFLHNFDQPVAYIQVEGRKYLVDGHHRVRVVRELGIKKIPAQEVFSHSGVM